MSGSLTYNACLALKARLETIGALAGTVNVLDKLPTKLSVQPSVAILPSRFTWVPWQQGVLRHDDGTPVVPEPGRPIYENGTHEGQVQIWVSNESAAQREFFQDLITNEFNQEAAPGRIRVTVPNVKVTGIATGWDATLAFTYGGRAEWRDERVFSERRWSFIDIDLDVPALSIKSGEYVADDIRLHFDHDTETEAIIITNPDTSLDESATLESIEDPESYSVSESGDVTPLT
jgi:hypothetical protein